MLENSLEMYTEYFRVSEIIFRSSLRNIWKVPTANEYRCEQVGNVDEMRIWTIWECKDENKDAITIDKLGIWTSWECRRDRILDEVGIWII